MPLTRSCRGILRLGLLVATTAAPAFGQGSAPIGPWKAERSKRGDTTIVRTVSGSVWGERVSLLGELRIGTKDGDGPDAFGFIQSLAVFPDGVIAVFDGSVPALRLFGADGKHVRTLGRVGAGPGEYRNQALGLAVDRDGVLLMYDPGNVRLNRWKEDGTLLPSWYAPGRLFTAQALQVDTAGNTYIRVTLEQPQPGKEWKMGLARLGPSGLVADTIPMPVIPGDAPASGTFFDPAKHWHLNRAGDLVSGFSGRYAITVSGRERVVRIERVVQRVSLLPDERKNYQEVADVLRQNPMGRPIPPLATVPSEKPFWRSLQSDLDGRIWVEVHGKAEAFDPPPRPGPPGAPPVPPIRWREPRAYDVFRKDGAYLGRLDFPARTSMYEARGDRIWAVQRGEDDEQYIVRYRISGIR
jgi:hypothetical protein